MQQRRRGRWRGSTTTSTYLSWDLVMVSSELRGGKGGGGHEGSANTRHHIHLLISHHRAQVKIFLELGGWWGGVGWGA